LHGDKADQEIDPMHVQRWLLCLLLGMLMSSLPLAARSQALPEDISIDAIRPAAPVGGQPIQALLSSPRPFAFDFGEPAEITVTGNIIRARWQLTLLFDPPVGPAPDYYTRALTIGAFPAGEYRIELYTWYYWQPPESAVLVDTFAFSVAQPPPQVIPTNSPWALLLLIGTAALLGRAAIARRWRC
jgi:hypothetical protein